MKPDEPDHPRSPMEARKLAAAYQCTECGGTASVGQTVRPQHKPDCPRAETLRKLADRERAA